MSKSSILRTNPDACPLAAKCGGCQLQNLTYDKQLQFKQVKEIKLLGRFHHVDEIIGMDEPYHYRHKVQAAFGSRHGRTVSGIYQSSTHSIVPVDSCMIEDENADRIIVTVRELMGRFGLRPFDDNVMKGFMRHVLVRKGYATGQFMVVLVTGTPSFPREDEFVKELVSLHPEITTVVQNVNSKHTSLVLGEKSRVLYGPGWIEDELCGLRFRLSPKAFYQINPRQTEILYGKAIEFAGLTGCETVLDAYCGTGTIGLIAARSAGHVIGVELNGDAVADAMENARLNEIKNAEFHKGDAGEFMTKTALAGNSIDVVIMDPPRSGASIEFLRSIVSLAPARIVYVSCNPETQARDVNYLSYRGYRVKKIQPVDMFPHTDHVESVVLIVRAKRTDNVKREEK